MNKNSKKNNTKKKENKNKSRFSIVCIAALILLIIIIFLVFKPNGEQTNENQSGEQINIAEIRNINIAGTKTVGDIEFSNIRINLISRNKCEFLADIRNTADKFLEQTEVRIKVINSKGEVDEVFGGIVTELANYEPNEFKITVLSNLMDAKDVEIEIVN